MAKKLAFSLSMEGSQDLIKDLTKVELGLVDIGKTVRQAKKDIDTFNNGTKEQRQELIKQGKTLESVTDTYSKFRAEQVSLQTQATRLRGELRGQAKDFDILKQNLPNDSLIALRRRYANLTKEVAGLSQEARLLPKNLKKIAETKAVKKQIDEMGESVLDFRSQVGSYRKALEDFFGSVKGANFGSLFSVLTGGEGGGKGGLLSARTAGLAALVGGLTTTAKYANDVLLKFNQINDQVSKLTQLSGKDLANASIGIEALSQTYGKDFTEVLTAVNALTKNVTGDFSKSIELVNDGLLSAADNSNQYLDSLEEYSVQAEAAGLSGQELNAILIRSAQEGIYSDKGIDLVKEFSLRIREQTNTTKTALEQAFGEKFTKQLFDNINDGSISSVDALEEIAQQLNEVELTAKQSGQVLADVFAGPGEDSGIRFIKTLTDIGSGYETLAQSTTAYQRLQQETLRVNTELITEQQLLAATLAGTGISFDNLTTQAKSYGTSLLNDVVSSFAVINDIYEKDGFFTALTTSGSSQRFQDDLKKFQDDSLKALGEVNEGEAKLAKEREENAIKGKLSLNGLVSEQQRLKGEVDKARVSGEDYTEVLKKYNEVTAQVTAATGIFNTNIANTKTNFKSLASEGSISQIKQEISDLQKKINEVDPSQYEDLFKKLNAAELDLSTAQKALDDFRQKSKESDVSSLAIEEQVRIYGEGIEKKRLLDIAAARVRIVNEEELSNRIKEINFTKDIELLDNSLRNLAVGSVEYLKVLNDIAEKKDEFDIFSVETDLEKTKSNIDQLTLLTYNFLEKTIDNEEELATRKNAVRLSGDVRYLEEQLRLQDLSAEKQLKLEENLIKAKDALKGEQAKLKINFDGRSAELGSGGIGSPSFDPNDIEGSLTAIKEYEERKTRATQDAELNRLSLEKELLIAKGEDTNQINQQIADQEVLINQTKNAKLIKQHEDRLSAEEKAQQEQARIMSDLIGGSADIVAGLFDGTIENASEASQQIINLMLDTVEASMIASIAQGTFLANSSPQNILSFGATGIAQTAILTAIIKGAFTVAKAGIQSIFAEDGAILANGGKTGFIGKGPSHANGGIGFTVRGSNIRHEMEGGEAVIKRSSTARWAGLLSAINEDAGGKQFHPDSAKWRDLLTGIKGGYYADGDIIGSGSQSNFPNLSGVGVVVTEARIRRDDIEGLVNDIVSQQTDNLIPVIEQISERVLIGLQSKERLDERLSSAQDSSTV